MKYLRFNIALYDWDIYYIEAERKKDADAVISKLHKIRTGKETIKEIRKNIENNDKDGAQHLYNLTSRKSVILLYKSTNKKDRINIIFHEKRHVEDRICKHLGIDDVESAAFIAGYIAEKLIPIL